MASHSPSSPRLPSPPPPAEIQIGPMPQSPGSSPNLQMQQMEQTAIDANARRRIHPGTKASEMAAGPPLVPLSELDSAFQLQEHLAALHYHHTAANTNPVTRETAKILGTPPPGIDRTLWLYELCRFLIEQCNALIVGFLFDTPPCSAVTCPEMRASEWQFLCAVHDQPKSCCAIDYCCHTLDWAANIVTNPMIFPSRFVALSDAQEKGAAIKSLINVFRRLHRIFAHAWFQHRGVFWTIEGQTGLYVFFKTVCDMHDLLPGENYKLPPEAEGLEAPPRSSANAPSDAAKTLQPLNDFKFQPTSIARPGMGGATDDKDDAMNAIGSRTSTRRHIRSSPSTGSAVTTVMEADEDDGAAGDVAKRFRKMRIIDPPLAEDDTEVEEVPVIVERDPPSVAVVAAANSSDGDAAEDQQTSTQPSGAPTSPRKSSSAAPPLSDEAHTPGNQAGDTAHGSVEGSAAEEPTEPSAAEPGSGGKVQDDAAGEELQDLALPSSLEEPTSNGSQDEMDNTQMPSEAAAIEDSEAATEQSGTAKAAEESKEATLDDKEPEVTKEIKE